jgi:hypothetical protein
MIAMLTVISDMDLSHDQWGFWLDWFRFGFTLVELVCNKWKLVSIVMFFGATRVRLVSLGQFWL